jgi:hypothetical protein
VEVSLSELQKVGDELAAGSGSGGFGSAHFICRHQAFIAGDARS